MEPIGRSYVLLDEQRTGLDRVVSYTAIWGAALAVLSVVPVELAANISGLSRSHVYDLRSGSKRAPSATRERVIAKLATWCRHNLRPLTPSAGLGG